jgi:eukaryotic-like serine/threonine-protein kinase
LLQEAAGVCWVRDEPFPPVLATLDLGLAREGLKDRLGACDAYRRVLQLWGNAKPRSVTAEKARDRMKAIGCGK